MSDAGETIENGVGGRQREVGAWDNRCPETRRNNRQPRMIGVVGNGRCTENFAEDRTINAGTRLYLLRSSTPELRRDISKTYRGHDKISRGLIVEVRFERRK